MSLVHWFHIFFVGALFLYVGFQGKKVPVFMFPFLKYVGVFVVLYHSYKIYIKLQKKQPVWVNLFHILLIGPLLLFIGANGANTPSNYFGLLLLLGIASIGYHGYCLTTH